MEKCFQCGQPAHQHPVVIVMKFDEAVAGYADVVAIAPGENWMALPICARCHQAPKLKGHFFMRADAPIALRLADMQSLALPGRRP